VWIDKRVRDVDMERQQVLSTDQRRLEVDAFARYRIVDPLRMYIARAAPRTGSSGAEADPRLAAAQRARQAIRSRRCCRPSAKA
jgi:regulator of protease activity HflC (stomatin/prohibitin superfamily)